MLILGIVVDLTSLIADGNEYLSTGYSDPNSGRDDWAIIEKCSSETNPIHTDKAYFEPDVICEP